MTIPPQSPSDNSTRTVGSFEIDSPLWWRKSGIWFVVVFVMIGCFGGLTWPTVIRSHKDPRQTEAVNNARQIGMALFEFEAEYGKFPDAATAAEVRRKTGSLLPLQTKTSNDFFRQLIAAGIVQREVVFYAEINGCKKPSMWSVPSEDLAKGECGFSYLAGQSSRGNPSRPLIVTPLIPGTDRFDPKPFTGKAVILKLDNSVTSLPIDKDGHASINGRNMMDPANPIWEGHAPVIAYPE